MERFSNIPRSKLATSEVCIKTGNFVSNRQEGGGYKTCTIGCISTKRGSIKKDGICLWSMIDKGEEEDWKSAKKECPCYCDG